MSLPPFFGRLQQILISLSISRDSALKNSKSHKQVLLKIESNYRIVLYNLNSLASWAMSLPAYAKPCSFIIVSGSLPIRGIAPDAIWFLSVISRVQNSRASLVRALQKVSPPPSSHMWDWYHWIITTSCSKCGRYIKWARYFLLFLTVISCLNRLLLLWIWWHSTTSCTWCILRCMHSIHISSRKYKRWIFLFIWEGLLSAYADCVRKKKEPTSVKLQFWLGGS